MAGNDHIDQERPIRLQHLLDSIRNIFGSIHTHRWHTHRPCQFGEIDHGIAKLEAVRKSMDRYAYLVFPVLQNIKLEEHIALVIANDELRADLEVRGCPQGL